MKTIRQKINISPGSVFKLVDRMMVAPYMSMCYKRGWMGKIPSYHRFVEYEIADMYINKEKK